MPASGRSRARRKRSYIFFRTYLIYLNYKGVLNISKLVTLRNLATLLNLLCQRTDNAAILNVERRRHHLLLLLLDHDVERRLVVQVRCELLLLEGAQTYYTLFQAIRLLRGALISLHVSRSTQTRCQSVNGLLLDTVVVILALSELF